MEITLKSRELQKAEENVYYWQGIAFMTWMNATGYNKIDTLQLCNKTVKKWTKCAKQNTNKEDSGGRALQGCGSHSGL